MYVPMIHDAQPTRLAAATDRTSKSASYAALKDSASLMPLERQSNAFIEPAQPISRIFSEHSGLPISQIRSARQAPSAILTEQYLQPELIEPCLYPKYERDTHRAISNSYSRIAFQKPDRYVSLNIFLLYKRKGLYNKTQFTQNTELQVVKSPS